MATLTLLAEIFCLRWPLDKPIPMAPRYDGSWPQIWAVHHEPKMKSHGHWTGPLWDKSPISRKSCQESVKRRCISVKWNDYEDFGYLIYHNPLYSGVDHSMDTTRDLHTKSVLFLQALISRGRNLALFYSDISRYSHGEPNWPSRKWNQKIVRSLVAAAWERSCSFYLVEQQNNRREPVSGRNQATGFCGMV